MRIAYVGVSLNASLPSGAFLLAPGQQDVTDQQFEEMGQHPVLSRLIKNGYINVVNESPPESDNHASVVDGLKQALALATARADDLEAKLTASQDNELKTQELCGAMQAEIEHFQQRVAELEQELASQAPPPPVATSAPDMTIPELKAKLTALGISFPSTANKADLQALLPK